MLYLDSIRKWYLKYRIKRVINSDKTLFIKAILLAEILKGFKFHISKTDMFDYSLGVIPVDSIQTMLLRLKDEYAQYQKVKSMTGSATFNKYEISLATFFIGVERDSVEFTFNEVCLQLVKYGRDVDILAEQSYVERRIESILFTFQRLGVFILKTL